MPLTFCPVPHTTRDQVWLIAGLSLGYALAAMARRRAPKKVHVLLVQLKFKSAEQKEAWRTLWVPMAQATRRSEPNCLSYEFCDSADDPTTAIIYERCAACAMARHALGPALTCPRAARVSQVHDARRLGREASADARKVERGADAPVMRVLAASFAVPYAHHATPPATAATAGRRCQARRTGRGADDTDALHGEQHRIHVGILPQAHCRVSSHVEGSTRTSRHHGTRHVAQARRVCVLSGKENLMNECLVRGSLCALLSFAFNTELV